MFKITTSWEVLDAGSEEEKAAFARLGIYAQNICFTEGQDSFSQSIKQEPLLSAYQLAQWLAWNWWRLRYESKTSAYSSLAWQQAHNMVEIGEGYLWPNLTFISDGHRLALLSKPSVNNATYRYLPDTTAIISAQTWQTQVDDFINRVIERLQVKNLSDSNLHAIWQSVQEERGCKETSLYRKLEALLGFDPDEAPSELLNSLIKIKNQVGDKALEELAASENSTAVEHILTAKNSITSKVNDRITLNKQPVISQQQEAWQLGNNLAKQVRTQLGNLANPITNKQLAELAAIKSSALTTAPKQELALGYSLTTNANEAQMHLTGKRETGRRFDLARLLADSLLFTEDKLALTTPSFTYRQKFQRAFAAELLCPSEVLQAEIGANFSQEKQEDLAELFNVSPLTIKNILTDNKLLERDDFLLSNIA